MTSNPEATMSVYTKQIILWLVRGEYASLERGSYAPTCSGKN